MAHQVALVPVRGEPLPVRFLVAKDGIHILANDEQKVRAGCRLLDDESNITACLTAAVAQDRYSL
jgi:hypothetical protein